MRRRRTLLLLAAAAVVGFAVAVVWSVIVFLDPYRLPGHDWRLYKRKFIAADGRVIDTGNENVTHSEGQGYALLIAVAYGDRGTFDRVWHWTRTNLQTRPNDKLISWLWKSATDGAGAVADPNNASDADLLVAWALLRAAKRWNSFEYQRDAQQILADLAKLDLREAHGRLLLLPGTDGFVKDDGTVVNPSYYVFPALDEIAAAFPNSPWKNLANAGTDLIAEARFGKWDLAPDWALVGETVRLAPGFDPVFGFNAVRIPLHLAWQKPSSPLVQPFARFWESCGSHLPATVDLETNSFGPHPALPGVRAIARFTMACARKQSLTVRALPGLTEEEPYFSASLNLLTKIAIRDRFASK